MADYVGWVDYLAQVGRGQGTEVRAKSLLPSPPPAVRWDLLGCPLLCVYKVGKRTAVKDSPHRPPLLTVSLFVAFLLQWRQRIKLLLVRKSLVF